MEDAKVGVSFIERVETGFLAHVPHNAGDGGGIIGNTGDSGFYEVVPNLRFFAVSSDFYGCIISIGAGDTLVFVGIVADDVVLNPEVLVVGESGGGEDGLEESEKGEEKGAKNIAKLVLVLALPFLHSLIIPRAEWGGEG